MYLAIPPQPDCFSTWREAVRAVDECPGHEAHNVMMAVADATAGASLADQGVALVDAFLRTRAKPLQTVSNTIFPAGLYRRHGAPKFFDHFRERVLPMVSRGGRWSGYYFDRMMTSYPETNRRTCFRRSNGRSPAFSPAKKSISRAFPNIHVAMPSSISAARAPSSASSIFGSLFLFNRNRERVTGDQPRKRHSVMEDVMKPVIILSHDICQSNGHQCSIRYTSGKHMYPQPPRVRKS